jgi:cysteine dioxygenase
MVLSTSPASVSFLAYDTGYQEVAANYEESHRERSGPISLKEFVDELPSTIRQQKAKGKNSQHERERQEALRGTEDDPVNALFSRLDLRAKGDGVNGEWWKKYALWEPMKKYTRNLIASDNETFTLLLLCWNPGKESPIHDHPCDGCWLRVCQGAVQETRYEINGVTDKMEVTSDDIYTDDAPAFIKDSMGYHKVGNPSMSTPAITLHLYCPPFDQCKIWLNPDHASRPSKACMCNYSDYGVKHTCEMFEVNMI